MTEPIKILADILLRELNLKPDQVLLYNQKFDIPPDYRMYINLSVLGTKNFAGYPDYEPDVITGDLVETQVVNRQEMISILVYSRSDEARTRNWEIPAALVSTYSEQQQEANSIKIGTLPTSVTDVSEVEGTDRLNRYALTFMVLAAYKKRKPVEFYDTFQQPAIYTNP
jgi:hypothetical protein